LEALRRYRILDTPIEAAFDDFAELATQICQTPIATVTLIDEHRQWFKAQRGLTDRETPREQAFCGYTILANDILVVEDAKLDTRFATNPLVLGSPHIRFYAGAPLTDPDGYNLGSICVIDREPRKLTEAQSRALQALARQVMSLMQLRRVSAELADTLANVRQLRSLLPICSHCKHIRNDEGYWNEVTAYIRAHTGVEFSHGICPDCLQDHYPDVYVRMVAQGKIKPAQRPPKPPGETK